MAERLVALDGLRGIAALAVVSFHVLARGGGLAEPFSQAYLAVDFFFLLSGYVLARTYEVRFNEGLSGSRYFLARISRLAPSILLGVVLGAAVSLWQAPGTPIWGAVLLQALMLPVFWEQVMFPLNIPQWSLFMELIANAVQGAIGRRLASWMLAGLVLAGTAGLLALLIDHKKIAGGGEWWSFWVGLARVSFSFFGGVAIWRLQTGGRLRLPAAPAWTAYLALLVVLVTPIPWLPGVHDFVVVTLIWPAILVIAINARPPTAFGPAWEFLGEVSYPLYAIHSPLLILAAPFVPAVMPARWLAAAVIVASCTLLAWLVARFYDAPLRRLLRLQTSRLRHNPIDVGGNV
ncbi:MAG TPA: acyltransferase [Hyphomonadaceae bacterium]|nr:acyltransferase [Hyphomonadaceae bacterium]